MKQHEYALLKDIGWLTDILESAKSIQEITKDITFEEFDSDMLKHLSVARLFEIIGEATKNLSDSLKKKESEIPWKKIAGMRDVLIHAYRDADNEIIWHTARNEIPQLIQQIQELTERLVIAPKGFCN